MEEIIIIDERQYKLTYDQPLTTEQRTQTISDIKRQSVVKTLINTNDAIKNGADRLVQTQNNDGTWEWSSPDTDPATTNYPAEPNVIGVTARGLVKAYLATGNVSYLSAAKKSADLLVSKLPAGDWPDPANYSDSATHHKVYGQDITFLVEFADAWAKAGNYASTYFTKANDYMNLILNDTNRFCANGCSGHADQLVMYNLNRRQPNLYGWDIEGWVEAAVKTGHMTFAQDIVSNMALYESSLSPTAIGTYPVGSSYVLGLSGYLQSYIMTGKAPAEYLAVKTKLLSELDTNGSFKIYDASFDGLKQTTAYALIALSHTNTDMTGTANYLVNSQSIGGQWIESDGTEYTEVDSEIITALEMTLANVISATLTVAPTDCVTPCTVDGTVSWTNTGDTASSPIDLSITVNGTPTPIDSAVTIIPGETKSYTFQLPSLSVGTYVVEASPNTGTTPQTITVRTPANIVSTGITAIPRILPCVQSCTVDVSVTWTNNGGSEGSFVPSIKIDDTPISPAQYISETLAPGAIVTHTFVTDVLTVGSHQICADPNGTCATVNVFSGSSIAATGITVDKTSCTSPCDVTIDVTWTNTGDVEGTFTPSIKIDGTPISPVPSPVTLAIGTSVTPTFSVTGLVAGPHTICAYPDSGTCVTINVLTPANIVATAITPSKTTCTEPCDLTVDITWTNSGETSGTFIPTIKVNGTSTTMVAEPLNPGLSITKTFSITGLMAGTHNICSDPNTLPCSTVTVLTTANVISATLTVAPTDCVAPCNVTGNVSWTNTGDTASSPIDLSITYNGSSIPIASGVTINPGETTAVYPFTISNLAAGTYTVQASPNTGTAPHTITVRTPVNIIVTAITPSVTTCVESCDLTVNVTWTNNGGVAGTFTPTIDIDGNPISPTQYPSESLDPGTSVTHAFTVTGLMKGLHTICSNPGIATDCVTITVGQVAEAGMGAAGAIMVTGLAVGTVLTAGTPMKPK